MIFVSGSMNGGEPISAISLCWWLEVSCSELNGLQTLLWLDGTF